ncbi:hypothetical protein M3Y97_00868100 [Aphelenchoides bicaudatus]|nr:hypothetical protein M3Y97_00868100 [Aphelenchoides bicaudatus]
MLTSRLFCPLLKSIVKQKAITQSLIRPKIFDSIRSFHLTKPVFKTVELETYEEMEQYFSDSANSLAVFDFYDTSNGISMLQSSRLQSKIDSADAEIDLVRVDVVSSPELSEYFQIEETPTLISFLNGNAFERVDGNSEDEEIQDIIETLIDQANED